MKQNYVLAPIEIVRLNSRWKDLSIEKAFEAWKKEPCMKAGGQTQFASFQTREPHLVLSVTKFKMNNKVYVDYRIWNISGRKFKTVASQIGIIKSIKDMPIDEFIKYCNQITQDIEGNLNQKQHNVKE